MIPRKRHLVLLILLTFILLKCPPAFGQYRFDSWTTENGLPQNGVRAITQTPDGYLWLTTFDGLVRFDGVKFTTFGKNNTKGIINNRFTGLFCDQEGTLYAYTTEGGTLTVYRNGVFTSYNSEEVPGHYIESIQSYKGETGFLIVGGENYDRSWYFLRDGKFVFSETLDKISHKFEYQGQNGAQWILTKNEITESQNGALTVYDDRLEKLQFTRPAFPDSKGGLWVGGFTLEHLQDGKVERFATKHEFPKNADFHLFFEEDDHSIWFANGGPSGEGLGLVRYRDGEFSSFGKESGLSDSSIFSVYKDREGLIWLGTNKGLNRLRKQIIKTYNAQDGLNSSEVYPILRDHLDRVWIGTTKGLTIYHDGKFEPVKLQQTDRNIPEYMKWKDTEAAVLSLWEDSKGKMWIGVGGELFVAENGKVRVLKEAGNHHLYAIREDKDGNVWAATNKGVLLYRDYKLKAFYSVADGLPNESMTTIYEDSRGRLWFGGLGGLSEFKDGKFINYTVKEGLSGNHVRSIYEDREGILWIGTYGEGLSRFKDGQFVNYKTENGLFSNDVFAIQEDSRENFWISSNRGIYRVNRQELNDFAEGKIDKIHSIGYGKEDGMLNNECNGGRQPSSIKDKDGNFWFPTQDGVVVVNAENETSNTLPPSVVIESATIEKKEVDISQGLTIEPGQRNIEINFTGISLIKSEQIKFKYKLEGHDLEWIDAGNRRTAYYSYLPPGNYQFLVKAANSDGIWNETGNQMGLEQKPFFYQTKWFYLLCFGLGCLALLVIWKQSIYQMERREKELTRLVDEKTNELRKTNEELQYLANSDGLTTVGNRRLFEDFLASEWHRAIRFKTEISLILLDIDHFKLFNDSYGHQAGDDCLKKVAAALREAVHRPTDLVARFGGEEFAIILGGTDSNGALNIAEQAIINIKNLQIPHKASKTSEYLTVSVGVATTFVVFEMPESELIKAADEALYQAKENGRNQIISNDMTLNFKELTSLEEETIRPDRVR
jgi:diguanylate cyclase (GGDEF)-like protein